MGLNWVKMINLFLNQEGNIQNPHVFIDTAKYDD